MRAAVAAVLVVVAGLQVARAGSQTTRRDILGKGRSEYSQHDEELIVRDYFQDRRDGSFLDVGCAWPIKHSNTFHLEHRLGWRGVGVDALPDYAEAWKKRRSRSRFFQFAVTDRAGDTVSFFRSDLLGISMLRPAQEHLDRGVRYEEIKVATITLTKLLELAGLDRIDFLSMDIEGAELPALAGFDIARFRPALACVESKPENRQGLDAYFAAAGYARLERYAKRDAVNAWYAPKGAVD
jgi:FkbM family methyltransferase